MKKTFFSKTLVVIFLLGGLSANAQVRVKTNNSRGNKKVVVKSNRTNNNRGRVRVNTNRHRVVVKKPNRPYVIVKRPNYSRSGYIWAEGYWELEY